MISKKHKMRPITWSKLLRYSRSQIVLYGTYATLLIPLIAQTINYVQATGHQLPTQPGLRIFAFEIYFSGLLLFIGRLLTQVICPSLIQRYPYDDDYFLQAGKLREARLILDHARSASDEGDAEESFLGSVVEHLDSPLKMREKWSSQDESYAICRVVTAVMYALGSCGIIFFLAYKAFDNIRAVSRLVL